MALIKCKECEKEYSDKANECPQCGCPTITNTIETQRKEIPKCSVTIKGNEKYYPPIWLEMTLLVVYTIFYLFINATIKKIFGENMMLGLYWGSLILLIFYFDLKWKKKKKLTDSINEYFQNRFLLLNEIPQNYKNKKTITQRGKDQEEAMFNIYKEAYEFDSDAIVLNNSIASTKITGNVSANIIGKGSSGKTTSTTTITITATLVRY